MSLTASRCWFQALKDLYTHLTPIQRVNIARHPNRPTFLDHVFNITDKVLWSFYCESGIENFGLWIW